MSGLQVAIVGGGAAGFFAAIACARANPAVRVTLLEATAHPLAKVRVSGGGRCNVTHACFDPRELVRHYPRGARELLGAFHRWQPRDTVEWFAAEGVELKTEADGRMFPVTDDSATIIDCLMRAARNAGVELRTTCGVKTVERAAPAPVGDAPPPSRFRLHLTTGGTLDCDRLLLASGGTRSSAGFAIARALGHAIEPLVPSLFTFHVEDPRLKGLAGVSVGDVRIVALPGRTGEAPGAANPAAPAAGCKDGAGRTSAAQAGPLLVTHSGLSGPAILKLSAWEARTLAAADYRFAIRVNFSPGHTRGSLVASLTEVRAANPRRQLGTFSPVDVPVRLWERLVDAAGLEATQVWAGVSNESLGRLAGQIVAAEFQVSGKSMNKEEFVTCGGVRLSEVDFRTMESRVCPGLFFAGEVLDIDGVTGGFNFQSAWTTGHIAGEAMGR